MIEFGQTLRAAREQRGYTVSQIAEMTRLAPHTVEELEREDFSNIAAAIYGRGFVKLYCEAVGLDAKAMTAEFMEIFNGNRAPVIRTRAPAASASVPPPVAEPPPAAEPPVAERPLGVRPPAPINGELASAHEAPAAEPDLFNPEPPTPKRDFSRYASPLPERRENFRLPPNLWRIMVVGIGALAVLALIIWGITAVYRLTMQPGSGNDPVAAEAAAVTPDADLPPAADSSAPAAEARTPRKINDLYLD